MPDFQITPKYSNTGTTIFTVMSALAQECGAINLSQGFPDFPVDERLGALLYEAAQGGYNQYAPMAGLPLLRQAIAADHARRYLLDIDPDEEITITPGATYAIYTAFATILKPGDEVIILEPAYDSYRPAIEMNGAAAVPVPLKLPAFTADWDGIRAAITPRTRAIIINTPNNPSGAVWRKEDWDTLAGLLADTAIYVLSDEVYEQLVYDGRQHFSVLQHEALRTRSFVLYSFGKVFHNTGWKIGYCIAPPAFTLAFRRIHQFLCFSVNTPAQYALARYLEERVNQPLPAEALQQKRDYFLELMEGTPFRIHSPAAGSYFQLASYDGISNLPDKEFAVWLTRTHGVAAIPVSAFYSNGLDDKLLRFCFSKKEETLKEAVDRLSAV